MIKENAIEIKTAQFELINLTNNVIDSIKLTGINDSKTIVLDSSKLLFLNFWATWCIPCVSEFPSIDKFINSNKEANNMNFIFATDDKIERVQKFALEKEYKFNYAFYDKFKLPSFINHDVIPCTYIIDIKKMVALKITGGFNYSSEVFAKLISKFNTTLIK